MKKKTKKVSILERIKMYQRKIRAMKAIKQRKKAEERLEKAKSGKKPWWY